MRGYAVIVPAAHSEPISPIAPVTRPESRCNVPLAILAPKLTETKCSKAGSQNPCHIYAAWPPATEVTNLGRKGSLVRTQPCRSHRVACGFRNNGNLGTYAYALHGPPSDLYIYIYIDRFTLVRNQSIHYKTTTTSNNNYSLSHGYPSLQLCLQSSQVTDDPHSMELLNVPL